ncbi:cytochrome P450 [Roseicella aerolata]|uniref:Cytochrome P450 n=1 Tax=Roseicella aerolata TaxID=2883479 RepID=A0A9X1L7F2_9PROT|nr:cytochrome P450 [Roseicella aerolata]MCB4821439.1 cytochrome P450 [Roseicella aerolata]
MGDGTAISGEERAGPGTAPVLRGRVPLLGMLPALARDPLAVFEQARALGDVVQIAMPGRHPLFLLAHPAHIRAVLQENHANYRRTPFHDRLKAVLGEGLVTSEGALWQRQRRLLQPAFRAERIRRFVPAMAAAAAELAGRWEAAAAAGRILDISQEMSDLALDVAVRCMFGREQRGGDAAISAALLVVQEWMSGRFWSLAPDWTERLPTPANRRFRHALATLDAAVEGIIAARLAAGETGEDLLGMLLAAQGEDGTGVDAHQVRDEAMTMLLAGHETSAAALTWTWHLLAQHPEAAEAVRAELAGALDGRAMPEAGDLGRLELTRAVLQEAMRLYPPVGWFGRLAAGPDRIGGCAIPRGAILALSPWLVQRDPRHWSDPARFDPGRFAGGSRPAPYTYFPFGGGPRTCIGNHFAMTEMLAALAVLVPRVRLRHATEAPVRPELMITLRPAGGLPMRAERLPQAP